MARRGVLILPCCLTLALAGATSAAADDFALRAGTLWRGSRPVLRGVPPAFSVVSDPTGAGVFLRYVATTTRSYHESPLGAIDGLRRFTSCYRTEPFWMRPAAGRTHGEVHGETQWLLAETEAGDYLTLVPLCDGALRFSLGGGATGLTVFAESDDPHTVGKGGLALFLSIGGNPYAMSEDGAKAVMQRLATGRLRRDKEFPDFAGLFGWCTWDSFYREVSAEKVRKGLKSFAEGGVEPRFMILDDGWQQVKPMPGGGRRLESFLPNGRFGGDLTPTIRLAKDEFKIRFFLVWHSILGYWGGIDEDAFAEYGVRAVARRFGPGIRPGDVHLNPKWWGPRTALVPAPRIAAFFDDYHTRLGVQGVDGVKVDGQAVLEGLAAGQGGRVALIRAYREALEGSVAKHFSGRLVNCMASSMEALYGSPRSTLTRTSTDFRPRRPETHGAHLYTNALVGVWFGQFMQPDWDMFQSAHAMGSFHAAARAVSGGPVYVSDTPEAHDFALLRKLVLSDGSVLRADDVGRPTPDCLFTDVMREPVLLKVFNYNRDAAVVGVFNANYHAAEAERVTISGSVSPSDVPGLSGDEFAAFAQRANRVWRCRRGEREPLRLAEGAWEIASFAPVERGVAVLGLADKLNGTGAVVSRNWGTDGALRIMLRDGGEFVAWSEKPPRCAQIGDALVTFAHDPASGRLSVTLPATGPQTLTLRW